MSTFALHNYIRINSPTDPVFQVVEQYPDYVPIDDISATSSLAEGNATGKSEMKDIRDNIAKSLWLARRRN